jgi:hypothetical protein
VLSSAENAGELIAKSPPIAAARIAVLLFMVVSSPENGERNQRAHHCNADAIQIRV